MADDTTTAFYEENAERFFAATRAVDMSPLYAGFLARLPAPARILDAGCGSGRDAAAFQALGHQVTACDASPALAALASRHLGQAVVVRRLEDIDWQSAFDGIWACASLLHIPRSGLPEVLRRLARALRPGGTLYCSFKYGNQERLDGPRLFTDLDEAGLGELLRQVPALELIQTWQSADRRPDREAQRWLNALLSRTGAP